MAPGLKTYFDLIFLSLYLPHIIQGRADLPSRLRLGAAVTLLAATRDARNKLARVSHMQLAKAL